ncbi:MAG: NGG1p interacting factor NIF3 [Candidatus Portnoybacteria bacterium]|nr:NGG1p interacting factor NIF3 [Candidatus Portnoybacteria bacterium]
MTIGQIYKLGVEMGIKADLRGEKEIRRQLKKTNEDYSKLNEEKKEKFDLEKLKNPYSDTRILVGDPGKEIKYILAGIDIETSELLLAKYLVDHGKKIDLVIAHHPSGPALAALSDVMNLQADVLANYGVPINIAEGVLRSRISEVARGMLPINHNQPVDAARLLDLPLVCFHTIADNLAAKFLDKIIKKEKPETLREILEILKKIPEYAQAEKDKAGPKIFVGRGDSKVGKIALTELTGGTEGSKEIYQSMANAGIGTVIAMHLSEAHRTEAEKAHVNLVIAGHISSDSLGLNLFLDELEKKGIEIIPCSGLIRVKRFKK